MPDMRYWFVDDNGMRAIMLDVTGADSTEVANVADELATQMRRIPLVANVISQTALDAARASYPPAH